MQVLEEHPQGIRWMDILRAVEANAPDTPHNSVHGGVHNLLATRTAEIVKVARGTYQLAKFTAADEAAANAQEQEMETAVRLKLNLVILILEDSAYGMIRWKQAVDHFPNFGLTFFQDRKHGRTDSPRARP
jgi:hypothetical protein